MPKSKNKSKLPIDQLGEIAQQAGIVLMTAAVTLGMVEIADHPNGRIVLPNQPVMVPVADRGSDNSNSVRRERDESAPHYVSYSAYQRTPGRTRQI